MKRFRVLLFAALFVILTVQGAYAETSVNSSTRVTAIPRVRINVDSSELNPGEEFNDDAFQYVSVDENDYYTLDSAEFIDPPDYLKVGDVLRVKVILGAVPREVYHERYDQIWLFQGGYGTGNVSLSRGTLESAGIRESGYTLVVIFSMAPVRGAYGEPASAYWEEKLGTARWTPSLNTSGIYDVILKRNDVVIKRLLEYSGETYDFYPYMTKEGPYQYQVRTAVPEAFKEKGASASEYVESGYITVAADQVSDGTGQTKDDEKGGSSSRSNGNYPNGTGTANVSGWITDETGSYFRYPGGEYAKDTWLKLSDGWYRFDKQGKMVRGWFLSPGSGLWYYLDPNTGIMKTGWLSEGGHWYFLKPEDDGTQGAMITGWQRINGELYYFNESGIMVTGWYQLGGQWYYFYPQGTRADGKYGLMARNVKVGEFTIGPEGYWIH